MALPFSEKLPINLLSSVFNNTTATYKFYWFIALVEAVEKGKTTISKKELFAKMISNSWFTINYFHLSFGKYDILQDSIKSVKELENLTIDENKDSVYNKLITSNNAQTIRLLNHFNSNVPHWFLSPWFPGKSKVEIYEKSKNYENQRIMKIKAYML